MAYTCEGPHFTVTVRSGFISEWQWAIHAVVDYRPDGPIASMKGIETEARRELRTGISRESSAGRDLGARTVVVLIEGDREIAGMFRGLDRRNDAWRVA